MKFVKKIKTQAISLVVKGGALKRRLLDDQGGVSPLVVTIGLALLLVGIIIAFSSTLQNAISTAINNVISKLNSL